MYEILETLSQVLCLVTALLLILIVMIQRDKGGSLSGLGGGGGQVAAFGVHTVSVVQKATWALAIVFLGSALSFSILIPLAKGQVVDSGSVPALSDAEIKSGDSAKDVTDVAPKAPVDQPANEGS